MELGDWCLRLRTEIEGLSEDGFIENHEQAKIVVRNVVQEFIQEEERKFEWGEEILYDLSLVLDISNSAAIRDFTDLFKENLAYR